jgi:hypothetical protein
VNLRSCAKCRSAAEVFLEKDGWYYAMCSNAQECHNDGTWGLTEEEASRSWNAQQSDILDLEAERNATE